MKYDHIARGPNGWLGFTHGRWVTLSEKEGEAEFERLKNTNPAPSLLKRILTFWRR